MGEKFLNPLVTLRERGIGTEIGRMRRIRGDVYPLPLNRIPSFNIRLRLNPYSHGGMRLVGSKISRETMLC